MDSSFSESPKSEGSRDLPQAPSPTARPKQHADFWFHDGSIILSVQNTLFRVHQTILSNHSEIFADLFTVPQPTGEDVVDGCHVVHLPDKVDDFVDLLKAVYDPSHFDTFPPETELDPLLDFISGILRLSTKYIIRSFRQRCIALLSSKFPTTFELYNQKATSSTHERYKSDSVMRAVNLARETNVVQVLPYAYYCVARISSRRMLKHRDDDIPWKDKAICLVGRERLRWAEMSLSHSFLLVFHRSPVCQSPLCGHARSPHAEWHMLEASKSPNPLRQYTRWNQLNVCHDCVEYCQLQNSNGRKEVWDRLPDMFDMPTWEELKRIQDE